MLLQLTTSLSEIINQTKANASYLEIIVLVPWLVFLINKLAGGRLLYLGIMPRHLLGIPGILCAPLLHVSFNHLFFNSIPLLVLSNFLLIHGFPYFLEVTLFITLLSGFLIWCFGKSGLHVGASAVITGYWALLVSGIYRDASLTTIILGVLSLYYFAGIFLGVFPGKKGVSWEGHLFGLIAGLIAGYIFN